MADEGTKDTFEKNLGGKVVTFRQLGKAQLLMLRRYTDVLLQQMDVAAAAEDGAKVDELLNKVNNAAWSAVESLFVDPADIEHVQLGIIAGTINDQDLLSVLSGREEKAPPADDEEPAPKKRAKKAAPAVAKANPRRAKR